MLDFPAAEAKVAKHVANIAKLGKPETGDKRKAAFLKEVVAILKEAKAFERTQAELNKRIKEAKALSGDLASYRKQWDAFCKEATKVAQDGEKVGSDTKGRDYYFISVVLQRFGSYAVMEEFP